MSNAAAAYYTYLSMRDRDMAATLRKFGYLASAEHVERRADRFAKEARMHAKGAESYNDPAPSASPQLPHDSDLHMASDNQHQSEMFGSEN